MQHYSFEIQPLAGLGYAVGIRYHGFHPFPQVSPVAIHIERASPVVIVLHKAIQSTAKIAKRLNVNSHVCNAWRMMIIVGNNPEWD
jgi:hypothetical protein